MYRDDASKLKYVCKSCDAIFSQEIVGRYSLGFVIHPNS